MSSSMITHLLLTTRYVMKGAIRTGGRRLQTHLGHEGPPQLIVENASLWELEGGRHLEAPNVLLRRSEVVLSHEYVDLAGDPHRSQLESDPERGRVSMLLTEPAGWELRGTVRATEITPQAGEGVVVALDPQIVPAAEETEGSRRAREAIAGLPYVLVNRAHVHCFLSHE